MRKLSLQKDKRDQPRVITGSAKGKKLIVPESVTRPATDRIKTTLFDLIAEFIPNAKILDLYAGSGALGIEALSRGAEHAVFIEADAKAAKIIEKNLLNTNLIGSAEVIHAKLPFALNELKDNTFDIIFCDPPYTHLDQFSLLDFRGLITHKNLLVLRLPGEYKGFPPEIIKRLHSELGLFKLEYSRDMGLSKLYFIRQFAN